MVVSQVPLGTPPDSSARAKVSAIVAFLARSPDVSCVRNWSIVRRAMASTAEAPSPRDASARLDRRMRV